MNQEFKNLNVLKDSIEKVFNTLAVDKFLDLYGLDIHFSVDDIQPLESKSSEPIQNQYLNIKVSTEKQLPEVFVNRMEPNFVYGKFAEPYWIRAWLYSFLKYIGLSKNKVNLEIVNEPQTEINDLPELLVNPDSDNPSEKYNLKDYYIFDDEAYVLNKKSGIVFPMLEGGDGFDTDAFTHLSDIETEEWWDELSDGDKRELSNIYNI